MSKVVVITGHSLLAQGIISNLRKSSHALTVESLDAARPDLVDTLVLLQPEIVIKEAAPWQNEQGCSLNRLFEALPNLIVLEVNLNTSSVQLIRSGLYDASGFAGLMNVLEGVRANLRDVFAPMSTMPHE
ncbi:MAG: hypothetical protein AB1750_17280 [Chloroflexota bacterium]